jgi:hypothetical protein
MHYRARSYDPRVGRFVQKDPVERLRIKEHFVYTGNDPLGHVDPRGDWRIARKPQLDYAVAAPESGDTLSSLASKVKLDAREAQKWLRIWRRSKSRKLQLLQAEDASHSWSIYNGDGPLFRAPSDDELKAVPEVGRTYLVPNVVFNITSITESLDYLRWGGFGHGIDPNQVLGVDSGNLSLRYLNPVKGQDFENSLRTATASGKLWGWSVMAHGGGGTIDIGGAKDGVPADKFTSDDFKKKGILGYRMGAVFLAACDSAYPEWYGIVSSEGKVYGFKGGCTPANWWERWRGTGNKPIEVARPK